MKKALSIIAVLALVAVLGVALVACVPSDPDKAVANLKEAGYITTVAKASDGIGVQYGLEAAYGKGCIATVGGTYVSTGGGGMINLVYFDSVENAKAYWDTIKDNEVDEGWKAARSGKVVYAGTEAAVKAVG
ncbi:MAG: hypothetical protein IJ033_02940 [Clostridia bacterium]|nr:hypothetical protein [Clostridia bacterium]